jgi:folate-dependent phosphoribosylglycinamide formyltransferase PurN
MGVVLRIEPGAKGRLTDRLTRYINPVRLLNYIQARVFMLGETSKAAPLMSRLFHTDGKPPSLPIDIPIIRTEDINSSAAVAFIKKLRPDIVCVNGTNLLREPMLNLIPNIPYGIINLHTGLSPYSRGGNCNLFMLLEGHPEFVGITIHHIDNGTDSGDIIISARPALEPQDNYAMIDAKTFRLGIDMMLVAIRQLIEGRAARVKQWEKGKLFLRKTGYNYYPYLRLKVSRLLKKGIISEYLRDRKNLDAGVKLIGEQN